MKSKEANELREAYAILDGVPSENILLDRLLSSADKIDDARVVIPTKYTVACGVAWLVMHPRYAGKGWYVCADRYEAYFVGPLLNPRIWRPHSYGGVAAQLLGIPELVARELFKPRAEGETGRSDKRLLLDRIKSCLAGTLKVQPYAVGTPNPRFIFAA
jgi:hypothetical protein